MNIEEGGAEPAAKELDNGSEIESGEEGNKPEHESGDQPNLNGRAEDREVREDGGEDEGEVPGKEEGAEPEPGLDLNKFEENLLNKIEERLAPLKKEEAPRQLTDEEWAAHEAKWGVPRSTIEAVTNQSVRLYNKIMDEVKGMMGGFQKDFALSALSKEPGFADVGSLKSGIDEFLKDIDPRHHSNPGILKKAAIYARGLKANSNVQRARATEEKNRHVVGRIKSQKGDVPSKGAPAKLSDSRKQAAELLGGGEKEYREIQKRSKERVPIAI